MATNQELRMLSLLDALGLPADSNIPHNELWMRFWDQQGIAAMHWNGRMLAWVNTVLGSNHTNVNEAMQAFAVSQGFYNWSAMGTFDAGGSEVFDFTGGSMPSGATLERASAGTYFNSSGVLSSASTDVARFDYVYSGSWSLAGLLIEGQRTNYYGTSSNLASGAFGGAWTANAAVAPDGTTTGDRFTCSAGGGNHGAGTLTVGAGMSTGQPATMTCFIKAGTIDTFQQLFNDGRFIGVRFDLGDQTLEEVNGTSVHSLWAVGNGWFVVQVSLSSLASASCGLLLVENFTAAGTEALDYWGLDIQQGATVTSYIPTSGAAATRAADVLTLDLDDGDYALEAVTPNGTFTGSCTVSGGSGYEFSWSDLTGASNERHLLSITAEAA